MDDSQEHNEDSDWLQYKLMIVDRLNKTEQSQKEMSGELQALQRKVDAYELCGGMVIFVVLLVLGYLKFHGMLKQNKGSVAS